MLKHVTDTFITKINQKCDRHTRYIYEVAAAMAKRKKNEPTKYHLTIREYRKKFI